MFFSTSLTATGLTLSALLLSASASPLQPRQDTSGVTCPKADKLDYCVMIHALSCTPDGHLIGGDGPVDDDCRGCGCKNLLPPPTVDPAVKPAPVQPAPVQPSASDPLPEEYISNSIQSRQDTNGVTCPKADKQDYCISMLALSCAPDGHLIGSSGGPIDEDCRGCRCDAVVPPPANPSAAAASSPNPPPPAAAPSTLTCSGTTKDNPNYPESAPAIKNQDYCTRAEVNAACVDGKVQVRGFDMFNVCRVRCGCK